MVDNNRVGIWNIKPRLNDCGGYQYIVIAMNKIQHHLFQFRAFQPSVGNHGGNPRNNPLQGIFHFVNILYPVVQKKHLSVPGDFIFDGFADKLLVESVNFRDDGVAVGRRRLDNGEVAGAHQRKLQGARDRRGCQGECVHIHLQSFQFFFYRNPELLLLINDKQSKVFKLNIFTHQTVGSDENIHFPVS